MVRQRMTGEERKKQLTEIAVRLFSENGFSQTTTKQIAESAGINEAIIYKHFNSKEELYDAAIEKLITDIEKIMHFDHLDMLDDFGEQLSTIAMKLISFLDKNVHFTRLLLYSGLQDHRFVNNFYNAFISRMIEFLTNQIRNGQEEGWVRNDVQPFNTAACFIGPLILLNIGSNILKIPETINIAREDFTKTLVGIYTRGISSTNRKDEK